MTRPDERPISLSQVRGKHPSWQIVYEHGVYIAVERPAQTAQNIVAAPDLTDLCDRLDQIDPR